MRRDRASKHGGPRTHTRSLPVTAAFVYILFISFLWCSSGFQHSLPFDKRHDLIESLPCF